MMSGRSTSLETIGILGGTFDPVHCAHLRLALEMRAAVRLDSVRLMPAPQSAAAGSPEASAEVRMRLLEAAVADIPGLEADGRELSRPGPTVTADTLRAMREELPGRVAVSDPGDGRDLPARRLDRLRTHSEPGPHRRRRPPRLPATCRRTGPWPTSCAHDARRPRRAFAAAPRGSSSSCATSPPSTSPPPACVRCARAGNRFGFSSPTGYTTSSSKRRSMPIHAERHAASRPNRRGHPCPSTPER